MNNISNLHSIKIKSENCVGCTNCLRVCPTEAIRIKNGTAIIKDLKCIDCGECIKHCPHLASWAQSDDLRIISNYDYRILILPSSFNGIDFLDIEPETIFKRIFALGFNEIWEEGIGAELYLLQTEKWLEMNAKKRPLISTSCPSVIRLLQVSFPTLIPNISPINAPKDLLAFFIREQRRDIKNLGVFYLAPCPARVTSVRNTQGLKKSPIDGVFDSKDLYRRIIKNNIISEGKIFKAGRIGLSTGTIGGEGAFLKEKRVIKIDGIREVKNFIEKLEEEKVPPFDFLEAWACPTGCTGGILLPVNNISIASYELEMSEKQRTNDFSSDIDTPKLYESLSKKTVFLDSKIKPRPQYFLAEDVTTAAKIMEKTKLIYSRLPKIDCGSCGAPSCYAFAEDVAKKEAKLIECIFLGKKSTKKNKQEKKSAME